MAQFPLVLAIEPRLLPYARLNGFHMDRKVSWVSKFRNLFFADDVCVSSIVTSCSAECLRSRLSCLNPGQTRLYRMYASSRG